LHAADLAGKPGDSRIIAAYLVGPSGRMLLKYFKDAEQVHNKTIQGTENPQYLPPLQEKTADMVECCCVEVIRGP
jgi:hypothetical protein